MEQSPDALPVITDTMIVEGERFLNQTFGDDLQFPIYVIRTPTVDDAVLMSVSGSDTSLHYRDRIVDWQGCGYLIRLRKEQMTPVEFKTSLLHEAAHCLHPLMPTPMTHGTTSPNDDVHDPRWQLPAWRMHIFHKSDFWRLCFHLWKRASLAGWECNHTELGMTYVDIDAMLPVIEPETIALLDQPLWKVALRPVPRDFQKLFDVDLSHLNPHIHNKEAPCQLN